MADDSINESKLNSENDKKSEANKPPLFDKGLNFNDAEQNSKFNSPYPDFRSDYSIDNSKILLYNLEYKIKEHKKRSMWSLISVYTLLGIIFCVVIFADSIILGTRKIFNHQEERNVNLDTAITFTKHRDSANSLGYIIDSTVMINSPRNKSKN